MDDKELRLLNLVGITYNQIESGVYALILQEAEGQRRLPIVIGSSEAQSIECKLQDIIPPRPLTHDLTVNIMRAYGLMMKSIEIKRIEGGIFAADILLTDGNRELTIDSRSSDAIALAIRMGAPIYTTEEVLKAVGIERRRDVKKVKTPVANVNELATIPLKRLESMLETAVEKEKYEEAAAIKAEIDRRNAANASPDADKDSSKNEE